MNMVDTAEGFVVGEFTTDPDYIEHVSFTSKGKTFAFPVDKEIKEAVIKLNKKGYLTDNSCQGHAGRGFPPYVSFKIAPPRRSLPGKDWYYASMKWAAITAPDGPFLGAGKLKTKKEVGKRVGKKDVLWFTGVTKDGKLMTETQFKRARKELLAWVNSLPKKW